MKASTSRVVEVFYRRQDGEPVEIYPRFCVDDEVVPTSAPCLSNGHTLGEQLKRKPDSSICFWRTYALDDILLLTPIFNWLKEEYPSCQIHLATATGFVGLFKYWDVVRTVDKRNVLTLDYDVGYYLDGIVEKDHRGNEYSYKHRLDIYCDFLGIPVPKEPVFSLPYGQEERVWAESVVGALRESGKPIVAMQVMGATKTRRMPLGKVMKIAQPLMEVCSLIFVHDTKESVAEKGTMDLTGMTTVHQLAALIDCADAVVTLDSGILWIAHCTKTPVIVLLGHTREQERMTYHRNYHPVNLAEMVGCESCFGAMNRCNQKARCMTEVNTEEVARGIVDGLKRLVFS